MPLRQVQPEKIRVHQRRRQQLGDLSSLAESIAAVGLLHPVVLDPAYNLVAGQRRLEAWKLAFPGTPVPCHVMGFTNRARAELDENAERLDLLPSEQVAAARWVLDEVREHPEAFPEPPKGEGPNYIAARTVGLSRPTLAKVVLVHDIAEGRRPELTVQRDDKDLFAESTPVVKDVAVRVAARLDEDRNADAAYKDLRAVAEQEAGRLVPEVRDDDKGTAPGPGGRPKKGRRQTGEGEVAGQLAWRLVQTFRQLLRFGYQGVDVAGCLAGAFASCQDGGTGWASDAAGLLFKAMALLPGAAAAYLSDAQRLPYDASPEERDAAFGEAKDLAASTGRPHEVVFMQYGNEKLARDVARYGLRDWEKAGEWAVRAYQPDGTFEEHALEGEDQAAERRQA